MPSVEDVHLLWCAAVLLVVAGVLTAQAKRSLAEARRLEREARERDAIAAWRVELSMTLLLRARAAWRAARHHRQ